MLRKPLNHRKLGAETSVFRRGLLIEIRLFLVGFSAMGAEMPGAVSERTHGRAVWLARNRRAVTGGEAIRMMRLFVRYATVSANLLEILS